MAFKVKLELNPYTALAMLAFVREYINDDTKYDDRFKAIQDAAEEYELELAKKITNEQMADASMENKVNFLIGKSVNVKQ
ncbi:MAG: hypothetical protein V4547_18365 [Bacteroidota bacterium]